MEEPYIKEPINKAFANTDLIDIGSLNEGTTGIVQKAFAEWNKYMFCYYPANKTIIPSAYTVRNMNIPDTITNTQDNAFLNNLIEKRKLAKMFNAIDNGCESVSEILSSMNNKDFRISMCTVTYDDNHNPLCVLGLIEAIEEDPKLNCVVNALIRNFNSVYYVDIDTEQVYPYKINPAVRSMLNNSLNFIPLYSDLMKEYIDKTVVNEEKETTLMETSLDNLREQFKIKNSYQYDYSIVRDGGIAYCRAKFVNIDDSPELHHMVVGFEDISAEKQRELERIAYIDLITGGGNYSNFKNTLLDYELPGFLISMDIHEFKIINSICGITKGDETLKAIWNCIENSIDDKDFGGHINADHFVIYCEGESEENVIQHIEKIEEALKNIVVTLKIPNIIPYFGITRWTPDKKVEEAYSEANFAKNQVKDRKDISYQFYSYNDTLKILENRAMEDNFSRAIKNNEFEIWYQPKYNPANNELVGAEALVRWRGEDGNLISPARFIPLFEKDGLIKTLDEYVFRKVCTQQVIWKNQGKQLIPISVNLSRATLYFESVVELYKNIASEIGVDTKFVPIEITESAAIDNANIKDLADRFHSNGFSLLVDDFGSGYSSLSTINMKCFDTLKIDKSLIDYIGDFSGERLLDHTITLAKELGISVTAEGVETKNQVDFLTGINCDNIQGFYYSKPLCLNDFNQLLA
jgi:EAL domain-containing protein (putative c-di-GMP-specific phosphodiesterase class I)/GGDEF domain-containing protein